MTAAPAFEVAEAPDRRRWVALAFIAVAQLMIALDATIVSIALPSAQAGFGASDADRQWMVTAYTLTFGGLLLLGGRVSEVVAEGDAEGVRLRRRELIGMAQHRTQELVQRGVGQRGLGLRGGGVQHPHASRPLPRLVQQRRFPDAGLAVQE